MEERKFQIFGLINRFIIISILATIFFSCSERNKDINHEYKVIVSNFTNHSIFIPLDIKYKDSICRIVIQNADLYLIMNEHFSEKEYEEIIYNSLIKHLPLDVNNKDYTLLRQHEVKFYKNINSLFESGIENVFNSFFNDNGILTALLSESEKRYLIDLLFQNGIYMDVDSETGLLIIDNIDSIKRKAIPF